MASYKDEGHPSRLQASPEVSNLDIRSTWSGSLDEPVNCRISMVAHCIPSTQLSILNIRSSGVSIVDTQLVRLQPDQYSDGTWSSSSSPPSPLFAFSSTTESYSARSPISGSEVSGGHVSANIERSARDLVSSVDGTAEDNFSCHTGTDQLGQPLAHSSAVRNLGDEYTALIDFVEQHRLRKRSATAAGLTDSQPGSDTEEDYSRKATQRNHTASTSPTRVEPIKKVPQGWTGHDGHLLSKEEHDNQLSGESVSQTDHTTLVRSSGSTQAKGVANDSEVNKTASGVKLEASNSSPAHSDTSKEPIHISKKPVVVRSGFDEVNTDFSVVDEVVPFPVPSNDGTKQASREVWKDPSGKQSNAGSAPSVLDVKESPLLKSGSREVPVVTDSEPDEIAKTRPLPKLTIPQPSHRKVTDGKETCTQTLDGESRSDIHCDPVFTISRGILSVKSPFNLQPGHYKFIVTISVFLRRRKQSEWNDLVIQGLPKLVTGEFGYLLFLMPEEYGLEFRTTNLQRHKIVENCFLAEFSYRGDLVIPLQRCERKFYGVVKDFTVHQEIRAEYAVASVKAESPPELQAKYHAVCSVRLHNRCFWAETCCLILSVDGGPDSVFRSKLDSQESGLKMIHIPARENVGMGSSYLQIICSPRDLELFCVNWTVRLSQPQAISWLPRIYPAFSSPSDRVRHHLRQTFEKVEAVSLSRIERSRGYKEEGPGFDDSEKPADIRETVAAVGDLAEDVSKHGLLAKEDGLSSAEDKQSLGDCVNMVIPRSQNAIQKMRLVFVCAIYVLGTILAFWLNNTIIDAVASPTKATSTVANLDAGSLNMSQSPTVHWRGYIGQPDTSGEGNTKNDPDLTQGVSVFVEANEEARMAAEATKADHESIRSAPAEAQSLELPQAEHEMTFRDRIDYWLGWRGPVDSEVHGEEIVAQL
ncbi:hypothetical protein AbraIFM66951_006247 [Aspergillus brasiliensis]|uniref:Transmembrane protein n=1 Tax=Aspergillus brasiliensis TaxID=319629 RepID=A0A9W5YJF3_9EURO|nr:hypothetical protein AbraCBS73388_003334 [Aspergillus brasiliensis]GKZ51597.1 hypothetical protein AbraIFM66951_006247 [Aspergillus brasiliensis]